MLIFIVKGVVDDDNFLTRVFNDELRVNSMGIDGVYGGYQLNNYDQYAASDTGKSSGECQTCKERKYQDGSNENVSFKAAAHISPQAAGAAVRAHEGEHVSNAYTKAQQNNAKVVYASVSIHTAVCPECGRTYVSGGTTNTQIKYYNEENPYQQALKLQDSAKYAGNNVDYTL